MSAPQLTSGTGEGTTGTSQTISVEDHECSGEPVARVYVNGTQIPVINDGIRTEIRKDGPLPINWHSEVYFPAEWEGEQYADAVRALDPNEENVYDPVDIEIKDAVTDEYVTVHRGFVMGTGGGSNGNIEHRMHVGDVSQLLDAIPFNKNYNDDATVEDVLEDVIESVEDTISPQVFPSVELIGADNLETQVDQSYGDDGFFVFVAVSEIIDRTGNLLFGRSGKDFQAANDSVQDVLDWLSSKLDVWFYFAPYEDTIALVADINPTKREFRATHTTPTDLTDGGYADALWRERYSNMDRVSVLRNNALNEIRPVNTLTVTGEQYRPHGGADYEEYPYASAVHERLAKKAGMPLEKRTTDEATSEDELRSSARQQLKELIDDAGHGEIVTEPCSAITPFSILHSKTACGDKIAYDVPALEYEVEEVVHNLAAKNSDGNRVHETILRADIRVDPDDIVVESDSERVDEVSEPGGLIGLLEDTIGGWGN